MRKWMLTATILLLGSLAGCAGPNYGGGCGNGGCGNGGCGNGGCASGGCGAGGCGAGGLGSGRFAHAHGVCDCEFDDYCSSRSPWIRNAGYTMPPVETVPTPAPAKLPSGKKDLE